MTGYPAPNYTETPNALFDLDMRDMAESELKVTLAIIRKILGYHKDKPEAISYSQLEEMTGLSRQGVTDGVRRAIKRGRVVRAGRGPRGISLFTINFADQSTQQTGTSQPSRLELVNEVDTQKKDSKEKETKKDSADTLAAVGAAPQGDAVVEDPEPGAVEEPKKTPTPHQAMFEAICNALDYNIDTLTKTRAKQIGQVASELRAANAEPEHIRGLWAWLRNKAKVEEWSAVTVNAMTKYWPDYERSIRTRPVLHVPVPEWRRKMEAEAVS